MVRPFPRMARGTSSEPLWFSAASMSSEIGVYARTKRGTASAGRDRFDRL
jgi:hypothetical protein